MKLDLGRNIPASIVVFLVALPLCMGVAMASGASVIQGILSGVIGGTVVGMLSGSHVSVSGPAAGLIVIVESAFLDLKQVDASNYLELFALVVFLAGIIQLLLGIVKLGNIADFIPVSVIKGMLAAIGIILILKQIPHLVGYDKDAIGEAEFFQKDGHNTFTELYYAFVSITPLALIIGILGVFIQIFWDSKLMKNQNWKTYLPAPLIVVVAGVGINLASNSFFPDLTIQASHLVNIPSFGSATGSGFLGGFFQNFHTPFWMGISMPIIWKMAFVIAIIASIESLLSLEAGDKIDPQKRTAPPNRELFAQGVGNMLAGLIGALPITAVIVRTSANVNSGSTNRYSAIFHGFWLLLFVLFFPHVINLIPLSALASILIFVGYKLAKPALFKEQYHRGLNAFWPFLFTIVVILLTDLLVGITIGMVVGYMFVLRENYRESLTVVNEGQDFLFRFHSQTSFMSKSVLKKKLELVHPNGSVIFDFSNNVFVDNDLLDMIGDFQEYSQLHNINVQFKFHDDVQKERIFKRL